MKIEKKIKDYFLTKDNFTLVKHDKGVLRTMPDLSDTALSKYYESEQYASHNRVKGFLGSVYVFFSRLMLKFKFGTIKRYLKKEGLVVDFGCGNGDFVSYVSAQNKKVIGIENNKRAVEVCEKNDRAIIFFPTRSRWKSFARHILKNITQHPASDAM